MQAHLVLFALALCVLYQVLVLAWGSRGVFIWILQAGVHQLAWSKGCWLVISQTNK